MDEWDAAATYSVKLSLPQPELLNTNKTELILAIPYEGDALRVYYKDKLLVRPCVQCHDCGRAGSIIVKCTEPCMWQKHSCIVWS